MGSTNLRDFFSIQGNDPYSLALSFVVTKGVVKGNTYAFRYRAINAVGYGEWSPITLVIAATIPLAPPIPEYLSSTNTTITLSLGISLDNGGSIITSYMLMRDSGNLGSPINIVESNYDGISSTFTVQNLSPGMSYRF